MEKTFLLTHRCEPSNPSETTLYFSDLWPWCDKKKTPLAMILGVPCQGQGFSSDV